MKISKGQLIQKQITLSKDSLEVLIKKHLQNIKNPSITVKEYADVAYKLYVLLLEPLAIQQQDVVVIPSELVAYLPFGSLVVNPSTVNSSYKKLTYTLEQWNFSYAFSSSFLTDQLTEVKQSFCGLIPVNQKEGDLSAHEDLMKTVNNNFQGVYFKEESNSLAQISKQHDFIHISSHGTFSEKDPIRSYMFMPGSDSSKLSIEQLYSTALNKAPFIVLNACETGEGRLRRGEGIDNFTRAFFYSGASGVIESSWKINANQTADLFHTFYQNLLDGEETSIALREAKLTYLKDQNIDNHFAHPYYWAGFRHFGTTAVLENQLSFNTYWLVGAGIVLLVLGVFLWRKRSEND